MRRVGRVLPGAIGANRKRAIRPQCCALHHKGSGVGQRATGADRCSRIGFGQTDRHPAGCCIGGAQNVHHHAGAGAVGTEHGKGVSGGAAGHQFVVRRACRVAPGPCCVDAECAVGACGIGLRDKRGWAVHIADSQRAAAADRRGRIAFGHIECGRAQHGCVVAASNGYRDDLSRSVNRANGEGIGQRASGIECLYRGVGIVQGIGPHASTGHGEGA